MNGSFDGQVAVVTGAGSGMGLATAMAFAEAGASVLLADISEQAVRAAADDLTAKGRRALAVRCDVADEAQVAAMVEQIERHLATLLIGPMNVTRAVLPVMRRQRSGHVTKQAGDPAKLAQALVLIASQEAPPRRFIAGADAIAIAEQKAAELKAQADAYRDLSTSLGHDSKPAE